jgi:hypothetical protein
VANVTEPPSAVAAVPATMVTGSPSGSVVAFTSPRASSMASVTLPMAS